MVLNSERVKELKTSFNEYLETVESQSEEEKESTRMFINFFDTMEYQQNEIDLLQQKVEIYKNHWIELADKILAEFDKDGWCKLAMTKEKAIEMKEMFESL